MRRGFWFVAGAGAGVYVVIRARRAAETFTPDGMRDRLAGLSVGAQLFADEVRVGMAESETDVRARLGLSLDAPLQLEAAGGHEALAGARSTTTELTPSPNTESLEGTH